MAHRQELESLGCGVVVVGQNKDVEQAEEWNTSGTFYCDFIHFCDPDKVFYKAYGFDRSLAGVWGPVSLDFYVAEQMSGKPIRYGDYITHKIRDVFPDLFEDAGMRDVLVERTGSSKL